MHHAVRVALLAVAIALATAVLGWWSVPLVGGAWGLVATPGTRAGWTAAGAAALGWAGLLAWTWTRGPVWEVARKVGPVFGIPGWGFALITLLFAALLAGLAAAGGDAARRLVDIVSGEQ